MQSTGDTWRKEIMPWHDGFVWASFGADVVNFFYMYKKQTNKKPKPKKPNPSTTQTEKPKPIKTRKTSPKLKTKQNPPKLQNGFC